MFKGDLFKGDNKETRGQGDIFLNREDLKSIFEDRGERDILIIDVRRNLREREKWDLFTCTAAVKSWVLAAKFE